MKIVIDNKLTYNTKDFALAVGDKVLLPPTPWMSENWIGTVTRLKSDHTGPIKDIVGVVTSVSGATARKQRQESAKIILNEKIAPKIAKIAAKKKSSLVDAMLAEQCRAAAKVSSLPSWKDILYPHNLYAGDDLGIMVAHAKFLGYKYVAWNGNVLRVSDINVGGSATYSVNEAIVCRIYAVN